MIAGCLLTHAAKMPARHEVTVRKTMSGTAVQHVIERTLYLCGVLRELWRVLPQNGLQCHCHILKVQCHEVMTGERTLERVTPDPL